MRSTLSFCPTPQVKVTPIKGAVAFTLASTDAVSASVEIPPAPACELVSSLIRAVCQALGEPNSAVTMPTGHIDIVRVPDMGDALMLQIWQGGLVMLPLGRERLEKLRDGLSAVYGPPTSPPAAPTQLARH